MITFYEYIDLTEDTYLSAKELNKYGDKRPNLLIKQIENGEPLVLKKGGVAKVTNPEEAIKTVEQFKKDKQNFTIQTDKGLIPNTQLKKTAYYGGETGGAGGGSVNTKTVESAQCLWLAAMLDMGSKTPIEEFTDDILSKYTSKISVDASLKDILSINDYWKRSSYYSAKEIIESGYVKKEMTFHRGDKFMTGLYKAKDLAFKNLGDNMTDDKWNPGDIWAKAPDFKLSDLDTKTPKGLQKDILQGFEERRLVGISLKGLADRKKMKATIKEYNMDIPPDTADHKLKEVVGKATKTGNTTFWSTKMCAVLFDHDGLAKFRDNTAYGPIKMEIINKAARGGSFGMGPLRKFLKDSHRYNLPHQNKIRKTVEDAKRGIQKALKDMYKVMNTIEPMSNELFLEEIEKKSPQWLHGKYGACLAAYPLKTGRPQQGNEFINNAINYAASSTKVSSAFIKVY